MWNSSTVFWPINCSAGRPLVTSKGECMACGKFSYYLAKSNVTEVMEVENCSPCPEAAECHGDALIVARTGFWHTHGPSGGKVAQCTLDNIIR